MLYERKKLDYLFCLEHESWSTGTIKLHSFNVSKIIWQIHHLCFPVSVCTAGLAGFELTKALSLVFVYSLSQPAIFRLFAFRCESGLITVSDHNTYFLSRTEAVSQPQLTAALSSLCVCVYVCVHACASACVRACVRVHARARVSSYMCPVLLE